MLSSPAADANAPGCNQSMGKNMQAQIGGALFLNKRTYRVLQILEVRLCDPVPSCFLSQRSTHMRTADLVLVAALCARVLRPRCVFSLAKLSATYGTRSVSS